MLKQTIAEYHCSQEDLYTVCKIGWANYRKFVPEFGKLKGFYTLRFADDSIAQINAAAELMDDKEIEECLENIRINLEIKSEVCKKNFSKLKMYINNAYHDDMQGIMHEQAGLHYFKDASNQNWHAVHEMNKNMISFMTTHITKLQANTNMPSTFEIICNNSIEEFEFYYMKYLKEASTTLVRNNKIRANNHLYRKSKVMFKDAKKIFSLYPELSSLFDFDKILQSINTMTAKIKGLVTDETDSIIPTAVIKIKYPDEHEIVLVVEEDGSYDTGSIQGGNAQIIVEAEGFAQVFESVNIPKGAIISKNLRLMRAA